jgi:hypothetical protein
MGAVLGSPTAAPLPQFCGNLAGSFSVFHKEVADDLLVGRTFGSQETGTAEAGCRNPCGNALRIRTRGRRALPVVNGNAPANCLGY